MNIKMEKSSESPSPPPTSFPSLPYDIVLNIMARISLIHRPTLSLVSKSFRSLLASSELDTTRSRIGKTDDCLYICLHINKKKNNPYWFALAPTPKRQRLLRIPSPYHRHSEYSTVVSTGSDIYIIGGCSKQGIQSKEVLRLACRYNKWSSLPDMIVPREQPAAEVINGKIYVVGGNEYDSIRHWGEVYDPTTQTWKLLTLDHLGAQELLAPGRLVMSGKVYVKNGLTLDYQKHICLIEIENNLFCQITIFFGCLYWRDANQELRWSMVTGLEGLSANSIVSVAKLSGAGRLTVWWKCKTEIWCAEISLQICKFENLKGVVEWSKNVFTLEGYGTDFSFSLDSAIVTLTH